MATAFHELTVRDVEPLTDDSAAVTFDVPDDLRELFDFEPGESLTLRRVVDGVEHRRTYSICAPAGAAPRIGVREIPGGHVLLVADPRGRAGGDGRGRRAVGQLPRRPGRWPGATSASRPAPASRRCCRSPRPCWPTPTAR